MKNKIVALGLAFATLTWAAPMIGQAATTDELQAQITALLVQIAALQAQLQTPSTTACFTLQLKFGSTGSEVTALQTALKGDATVYPEGLVTGYFGSLTEKAVKAFQTKYGIEAVGQVGPITRAKLNTLFCVTPTATPTPTPTPTATPVAGPLTVTLASDNPAGANVQRGSANNTLVKFVLTGGSTTSTITGIALKSYGTTAATGAADITKFKLYDENGVQLGSDRTSTGNVVNFVIVPALTIPVNGSRTVTVTADIATAATVVAVARYGLESTTAITGATFGGTYPVIGNSFTIVPAGQLGAVNATKFSIVPKSTVKIGNVDAVLGRYNISAGSNEDIVINQITVTNNAGTVSDSDISNLRIRKAGGEVITGSASLSNKKVTFVLTTPITLVKGASINVELIGNIASGDLRTIKMEIAASGVIAKGSTSGTNMTNSTATGFDTITIGLGTLTVSMSANHPQGANSYLIKTTNLKTLAAFSMRANGENIILSTVDLKIVDSTDPLTTSNYLSNVGLYAGDALVSNLITVDDEAAQQFSLNVTIPGDTTTELTVKGVTNTITAVADSVITTFDASAGFGLSSGEAINNTIDVDTTAITIYPSGTVTPSADTTKTLYNQALLVPSINATVAALKLYALREDMKLTNLVLTVAGTGVAAGDISSVTLYADDGTVLSNPVANTALTYVFDTTAFINDIVFTKGVYKTILVKANTVAGLDTATGVTFTIADVADQLNFVGQDSGTAFDNSTAGSAVVFAIASPAAGTYSGTTKVVTIAKATTSPSGSVSRGTESTVGVWDVNNYDSTNAAAVMTMVKFTSKTGLPSGIVLTDADADELLFKLYDGNLNLLSSGAAEVDLSTGAVSFTKASMLTINSGEPKQLKLVIDTTNTTKLPSNTQFQWSIETVGDVTITNGAVGYAAGIWTIPAVASIVTLP